MKSIKSDYVSNAAQMQGKEVTNSSYATTPANTSQLKIGEVQLEETRDDVSSPKSELKENTSSTPEVSNSNANAKSILNTDFVVLDSEQPPKKKDPQERKLKKHKEKKQHEEKKPESDLIVIGDTKESEKEQKTEDPYSRSTLPVVEPEEKPTSPYSDNIKVEGKSSEKKKKTKKSKDKESQKEEEKSSPYSDHIKVEAKETVNPVRKTEDSPYADDIKVGSTPKIEKESSPYADDIKVKSRENQKVEHEIPVVNENPSPYASDIQVEGGESKAKSEKKTKKAKKVKKEVNCL